ncbi:MAG: uracil-DNA glycosylase [Patescibacteria group bacterium]
MTLEEIEKQVKKCKKCRLYKERKNAVFGEGNYSAKIVFIGEAPGKNEDLEGRPFIGSAGKFLNSMLESINIRREDVFITNIVKCRPPNNREPLDDEVYICTSLYLWNQLELINPILIVILGRHSMYRFLPKNLKISDIHGKLKNFINEKTGKFFNILPLYHPAAALYNGSLREILKKDFKKIPKILEKLRKKDEN